MSGGSVKEGWVERLDTGGARGDSVSAFVQMISDRLRPPEERVSSDTRELRAERPPKPRTLVPHFSQTKVVCLSAFRVTVHSLPSLCA